MTLIVPMLSSFLPFCLVNNEKAFQMIVYLVPACVLDATGNRRKRSDVLFVIGNSHLIKGYPIIRLN